MNTNSNSYTIIYSLVMVILVAALLAYVAIVLQPAQEQNIVIEKKQNILASVGLEVTPQQADSVYAAVITQDFKVDAKGQKLEGKGFEVDLVAEVAKPAAERRVARLSQRTLCPGLHPRILFSEIKERSRRLSAET